MSNVKPVSEVSKDLTNTINPQDGIYANVFFLTGDKQDIIKLKESYIPSYEGVVDDLPFYPFRLDEPLDKDCISEDLEKVINGNELLDYIDIVFNNDVNTELRLAAEDAIKTKIKIIYENGLKYMEENNVKQLNWKPLLNFMDYDFTLYNDRVKIEEIITCIKSLDSNITMMVFEDEPRSEDFKGFYLLSHSELQELRNEMNVVDIDDETIACCVLTKHGIIHEYLEDIVLRFGLEGQLLFGNGNVRGRIIYEKGSSYIDSKEPSLDDTYNMLDVLGLLDVHLEKFQWHDFDVYQEEDEIEQ